MCYIGKCISNSAQKSCLAKLPRVSLAQHFTLFNVKAIVTIQFRMLRGKYRVLECAKFIQDTAKRPGVTVIYILEQMLPEM